MFYTATTLRAFSSIYSHSYIYSYAPIYRRALSIEPIQHIVLKTWTCTLNSVGPSLAGRRHWSSLIRLRSRMYKCLVKSAIWIVETCWLVSNFNLSILAGVPRFLYSRRQIKTEKSGLLTRGWPTVTTAEKAFDRFSVKHRTPGGINICFSILAIL